MRPSSSALLRASNLPAQLITNIINIRYLTGVKLTSGIVLAVPRGYILFVDGRYTEAAIENAYPGIRVKDIAQLETVLPQLRRSGFESDDVTVARLDRWKGKFKSTKFIQTSGLVEGFRRKKDVDEIRKMKRARSITIELLRRIPAALRKGQSEREVSWKIEGWARELGAEKMSFESIVAFGSHSSRPHHRPTTRTLKKGDIVQIDLGVVFKGYCSDLSEVFFTAKPTSEQAHAIGAVREAKEVADSAINAGAKAADIDNAARSILKREGLDQLFIHALGHGVGLEVHEGVTLSYRAGKEKILSGEVLAVEPGVYFPGKFGVRVEDMVFVE